MQSGILYIVAGPIGNLKDITYRAVEILSSVSLILSEDTRDTQKLLNQYSIAAKQLSYRDQNHSKMYTQVLDLLKSGSNVALVSDGGTPLISDPGFKLVRDLKQAGIEVKPIPGPCAFVAAASVAGLPTDKITYVGFLPKGTNQRAQILTTYGNLDCTLAIYESPYRINKLLTEVHNLLGNRYVSIAREITKLYEQVLTAPVEQILKDVKSLKTKGEFVILVAKKDYKHE